MRWRSAGYAIVLTALCAPPASAHGGGLDRHGCHHDRRNGGYHCHGGASTTRDAATPRRRPAQATYVDSYAPVSGRERAPVRDDSLRRQRPAPVAERYAPAAAKPSFGAYRNCTEARTAGAAPVRRGDPGYGPHLDRDNDGIGCEPYRGR